MNQQYTIGIDVGGTNTDAVLVGNADRKIIATSKIASEKPLEAGIIKSILSLMECSKISPLEIRGVYIGTTHVMNAILAAREDLLKVGVLRIAGHNPTTLDPCFKWPEYIRRAIFVGSATVSGGFRCDRKEISPISEEEIVHAIRALRARGMESLAIVGVFSPLSSSHEKLAQELALHALGEDFPITLSSDVGGLGFIERENACIINASLKHAMAAVFQNLERMKEECLSRDLPLYLTQNDGSIIDIQQAIDTPLLTLSSGPTNSFIGGARLASLDEAIVIDVGGTSTDIGVILNGIPRRSMGQVVIGGIPLNFRVPDVISLPIGGGTIVRRRATGCTFGPDSLGHRLFSDAISFGGETLTLTDVASKASMLRPAISDYEIPVSAQEAEEIIARVVEKIQGAVRLMRGSRRELPVVVVGGGAFLAQDIASVIPENGHVANAYGASLAEISHTVDSVLSLEDGEKALACAREEAVRGAVLKGADISHVRVIDVQVLPYHYLPNKLGRVIVKASGRPRASSFVTVST